MLRFDVDQQFVSPPMTIQAEHLSPRFGASAGRVGYLSFGAASRLAISTDGFGEEVSLTGEENWSAVTNVAVGDRVTVRTTVFDIDCRTGEDIIRCVRQVVDDQGEIVMTGSAAFFPRPA